MDFRSRAAAAAFVLGALFAAPAGCSNSTDPDANLRTEITYAATNEEPATAPDRATVSLEGSRVQVAGAFTAADPCRELKAAVNVEDRTVLVTVRAALPPNPDGCIAVLQRFTYDLGIIGLSSGEWTIEVRHRELGLGAPVTVETAAVVVP